TAPLTPHGAIMATATKPASPRTNRKPRPKRRITPEDLTRLVYLADPQISPDGTQVLFLRKHIGEKNHSVRNLWVVPADGDEPRQFTSGEKDGHGRWSPDGRRIALMSGREESKPQIYVLSSDGGEATQLTKFPEGSINHFKWSPDGKWLAVSYRQTDPDRTKDAKKQREEAGASTPPWVIDDLYYRLDGDGYFGAARHGLYVVNAETGEHRLLFDRDALGFFTYDWSPDSTELVVSCNTQKDALLKWWKDDLYRVDLRSGRAKKIPGLPIGHKSAVHWSPNGERIAYAGREGRQEIWGVTNAHLYVCSPDGGGAVDLTGGEDYCLVAVTLSDTQDAEFGPNFMWGRDGRRISMGLGWQGSSHLASISADGGVIVFHTEGRRTVQMGNASDDGTRFGLTVADQLTPAEIAIGAINTSPEDQYQVTTLTSFNKNLVEELELAPAESYWTQSASGTPVHFWIMKPPGFSDRKKHPAVLEVHGGPHTQYGECFFHEFQVLAANGYVVVYSNPRGSKGYGEQHCASIRGCWGATDWEDVQAVVQYMKTEPYIDRQRMGIMGGSYGGYLTNWAIGHTDDFAAAITDRCVANLVSMVGSSDLPLVPGEYWEGNSWDNTKELWNQSPLKYFGNVKTPTLIIHSEGDLRCNVEQAEQVFAALKLRGIPTRFVRYPASTSHGMSRGGPPDLRIHRLNEILDWWRKHLT
ncbi:MAG: S9 family peptidase, partial [Planctomycetaceae bacterium]